MTVADAVSEVEAAGAAFRLDGEKIRVSYPDDERRKELAEHIALLRDQRAEVVAYLKARSAIPRMPPGVRLIEWTPKEPPVAINTCSIVTDSALFASTTLAQLGAVLANVKRWVGWSVPELIDRLAQVGIVVVLGDKEVCSEDSDRSIVPWDALNSEDRAPR